MLILGVDCRKDKNDGVDCASNAVPIEGLAKSLSLVTNAVGELLQPRHGGICVHPIPASYGDDQGYLVIDVPRSERRPHRSEAQDQKQYFKRAGGSSFAMEHEDIEDAFKRRSAPVLELGYSISRVSGSMNANAQFMVSLRMALAATNSGDVSAKHVGFLMISHSGVGLSPIQPPWGAKVTHDGQTLLSLPAKGNQRQGGPIASGP